MQISETQREIERSELDFVVIFFVSMTSKDDENDVEESKNDQSDVNCLVSGELCMGKSIVPVDGHWKW